jgi:arylsulfatase A-like enzyme
MRVLLLDVDSLRPDRLGCYGYERETSPTIDDLASSGVVFDRCFASDTPCLPSRTALATGRFGLKTGVVTHHGTGQDHEEPGEGHSGDPDRPLTFRQLSEAGVHTASISSFSKRHLAYHFSAGFRESIQPTTSCGMEHADDVTPVAVDWLDRHAADDDWLLHVNYWDVHQPYRGISDETMETVRESGPAAPWPDEAAIAAQQPADPGAPTETDSWRGEELDVPGSIESRADAERIIDCYDAAIRKVDDAVAELLGALERAGVREETTVVVTADHGEALGEHVRYCGHGFPHPPCQQVPMIVSGPMTGTTGHVDAQAYQFDLSATLLDQAGLDVPARWDAAPFSAALDGRDFDGREYLVCGQGIASFGRAVYRDQWVYIRLLHPGKKSMPGQFDDPDMPGRGHELLHNLDEDPHMTENVISEYPAVADELALELGDWHQRALTSPDAAGRDPLAEMAVTRGPFLYTDEASASVDTDFERAFGAYRRE